MMMGGNQRAVRVGLAVLVLPFFRISPVLRTSLEASSISPDPHFQVTFVPPAADFPTPFGDVVPSATPIPTLGPGQAFEQNSFNRPEAVAKHGDDDFGYGPLQANPSLLLIWFTDQTGTHYLVVDESNEDQNALVSDFKQAVSNREAKQAEIQAKDLEIAEAVTVGRRGEGFAIGFAVAGGICGLITGGVCIPFALAAAAVYGLAWDQYFKQNRLEGQREILVGQLNDAERILNEDFSLLGSTVG